jgi:subtilase family serine protease
MRRALFLAALACTVGLATAGFATTGGPAGTAAGLPAAARPALPVITIRPGAYHPEQVPTSSPLTTAQCEHRFKIACYEAGQVEQAFGLPVLYRKGINGAGQTIVIVDSFGSPTVRRDLAVFDHAFHLPAPPSLKVIQPAGKVAPYNPKNDNMVGWAGETELDVEYSHAIAPHASILLVETPTSENEGVSGFPQIEVAEEYVLSHHLGGVISQSFSATEQSFPTTQALLWLRHPYIDAYRDHVTVLAASGDSGAADTGFNGSTFYLHPVTSWPDSDPLVTGVGGVQLHLNAAGKSTAPDSVWNDTYNKPTQRFLGAAVPDPTAAGGGKSIIFARPGYQDGVAKVVGDRRGVPDISMSGACNGAVDMYQSFGGQAAGWYPTCGTSEATPEFAGIVSLADQVAGHPIGLINPALYTLSAEHAPGIVDITRGNNTVSFRQGGKVHTVHGFSALPGYDLASGVGTVYAPDFVPELAHLAG